MNTFKSLGLPETLLDSLNRMNFTTPTPIQAQTIPLALKGSDILGTAQTGTGKTAAFAIPAVTHLIKNPNSSALILTPTRELALQVMGILKQLIGRDTSIDTALIIGGDPIIAQFKQLKKHPRLVIGTPGRINDHLLRQTLKLHSTDFIVFDETDRMLDMGFVVQLNEIVKFLPEKRQTLMFSATIAPAIVKISQTFLKNEERISVGSTTNPIDKIKQETVRVKEDDKYELLKEELGKTSGSVIVFARTKYSTEKLATKLQKDGYNADAIHGDLRQRKRERVIDDFRKFKTDVLVATDVAARGLDIPHIECVVNFNLPQSPEDYIHRIGRTGRAGAEGRAVNFISSSESKLWHAIEKLMNPNAKASHADDKPFRKTNGTATKGNYGKPRFGQRDDAKGSSRSGSRDGARKPRSSFGNDRDRQQRDDRPRTDRPFGDERRPGKKRFGEKKPFGGNGERSQRPDRPFGDERRSGEKRFGEKKPFGGNGERSQRSEKPFGEKKFGDNKFGAKKPSKALGNGDKPLSTKKNDSRFGKPSFSKAKPKSTKPSRRFT